MTSSPHYQLDSTPHATLLRMRSADGTNRLTVARIRSLTAAIEELSSAPRPLVITGNPQFFSVGADLNEVASLTGAAAYEFALQGQALMNAIAHFPAVVYAAIEGHCMGGGLDLALACHRRIAAPHAAFGHRGAALGLMTGWGGTQRLPRLIGQARALQIFVAAARVNAAHALRIGLVDCVVENPVAEALQRTAKNA